MRIRLDCQGKARLEASHSLASGIIRYIVKDAVVMASAAHTAHRIYWLAIAFVPSPQPRSYLKIKDTLKVHGAKGLLSSSRSTGFPRSWLVHLQ